MCCKRRQKHRCRRCVEPQRCCVNPPQLSGLKTARLYWVLRNVLQKHNGRWCPEPLSLSKVHFSFSYYYFHLKNTYISATNYRDVTPLFARSRPGLRDFLELVANDFPKEQWIQNSRMICTTFAELREAITPRYTYYCTSQPREPCFFHLQFHSAQFQGKWKHTYWQATKTGCQFDQTGWSTAQRPPLGVDRWSTHH